MQVAHILIIDDDEQARKLLSISLQSNNYKVTEVGTSHEGLQVVASNSPDLVLLDLNLPNSEGYNILRHIREWFNRPVIVISELNTEEGIISALDAGADDYLVKPIRTSKLLDLIKYGIDRLKAKRNSPIITYQNLTIDFATRTVFKKGIPVILTTLEYAALVLMAKNEGRVMTHHFILRQLWGATFVSESQYLLALIAQLRNKIEEDPTRPQSILTESGIGYRFIGNPTTNSVEQ